MSEYTLKACIDALRRMDGVLLEYGYHLQLAHRIEELTRWIPVSERLPSKEDANYHDEVLVCLDPMSAVNSPCLETGVEIVHRNDVSPDKHLYWKRADVPEEYYNHF